jgi:hypothetical protein
MSMRNSGLPTCAKRCSTASASVAAHQPHRQAQAVAIDDPEQPAGDRPDLTQRADLAIDHDQRFLHRLLGIARGAAGAARIAADVALRDRQQDLDRAGVARCGAGDEVGVEGFSHR